MFKGKGQGCKALSWKKLLKMQDKQGIMNEGRSQWRQERMWSELPDMEGEQLCREQRRGKLHKETEEFWVVGQRTHMGWPLFFSFSFFHLKEGWWEAGVLRKETKFRETVLRKNVFGLRTWMKSLFICRKAQPASRVCDFLQARQGNLVQTYTEQREWARKPHRVNGKAAWEWRQMCI